MPLIQIKYSTPAPRPGLGREIAEEASRLAAAVLGKDPAITAVIVEAFPAEAWFCGGEALSDSGRASFALDIRITAGTNTKDETTAFVADAFAAMQALLGRLHEESYVHVHAVDASAYGFGGLTQEHRYVAGKHRTAGSQALSKALLA